MADRNVDVKFRFLSDRAATTQLLRDQDRVEQGYDDIVSAANRTASAQQEAIDKQIRLAREEAGIYGDVASRTTALSGLASAFGGTAAGGRLMIAADILDATEAAKSMRAELPKMTSQLATAAGGVGNLALAGGAAALAVAGLYAAVEILGKKNEEAEAKTRAHINALEWLLNLEPGTTEQLKEERDQLQQTMDRRQGLIDQLKEEKAQLLGGMNDWQQLGEALGVYEKGVDEYNAKIKELSAAQDEDRGKVEELTTALEKGIDTTGDRLKAEQEALAALEKNTAYEIELRRKVATYTVAQVNQELAALERQKTAKQDQLAALDELSLSEENYQAESKKLSGEINGLSMDMADLNTLVRQSAEVREREAKRVEAAKAAIEALNQRLDDTIQKELDRGKAITQGAEILAKADYDRGQAAQKTQQDIADSEGKYQSERTSATQDFEQQRLDVESRAAEERAALVQDHEDALTDIETKYREDKARAEQQFRRDQKRAEEDHRDTLLDAAANLDAPAVMAEQRRFTKDQKRAEEDFKTSQKERDKEYRQQLKDENDAFQKRQQQAQANARKELQRLQQQYNTRLQQMDSAHRAELQRIQQAGQQRLREITDQANKELKQLFGFNTSEYSVRAQHYADLLTQLKLWSAQAKAVVSGTASVPSQQRVLPGQHVIEEYQTGGYLHGGLFKGDAGEYVLNRPTTRALERGFGGPLTQQGIQRLVTKETTRVGDVTVIVNGAGNPEAVGEAVQRKLGQILGIA